MSQKIFYLAVLLCIVIILVGLRQSGFIDLSTPVVIKEYILGFGVWAPFMYMGLYIVASLLFIPGTPLTLIGGAVFGPLYGTVYTVIGATLGALCAFIFSRTFGRRLVSFGTGKFSSKLSAYDERIATHGFVTVLFLRFVPLFPFNVLNFALGLTRIRTKEYALGTFFGIIPGTFVYVYFGNSLASLDIQKIGLALVCILVVSLVGKKILTMYNKMNV